MHFKKSINTYDFLLLLIFKILMELSNALFVKYVYGLIFKFAVNCFVFVFVLKK